MRGVIGTRRILSSARAEFETSARDLNQKFADKVSLGSKTTPSPPAPLPQRGEGRVNLNLSPSPLWGRGWTATGVFISRGGTGEGVL